MISIILPTFNGEAYLRESIESILRQTYTEWELIVIDDCSTDNTPNILEEYQKREGRIRCYRNEINLKLPKSLNKGFSYARGDYLSWTSDDNLYKENAFEEMLAYFDASTDMVFSRMEFIDEHNNITGTSAICEDMNQLYWANIIGACFMYRRKVYETIGDYNADKFLAEDYDYWLRINRKFTIKYIPKLLYSYRTHPQNLSSTRFKEAVWQNIRLLEETLEAEELSSNMRKHIYAELADKYYIVDDVTKMRECISAFNKIHGGDARLSKRVRRADLLGATFVKYYKKLKKMN